MLKEVVLLEIAILTFVSALPSNWELVQSLDSWSPRIEKELKAPERNPQLAETSLYQEVLEFFKTERESFVGRQLGTLPLTKIQEILKDQEKAWEADGSLDNLTRRKLDSLLMEIDLLQNPETRNLQ